MLAILLALGLIGVGARDAAAQIVTPRGPDGLSGGGNLRGVFDPDEDLDAEAEAAEREAAERRARGDDDPLRRLDVDPRDRAVIERDRDALADPLARTADGALPDDLDTDPGEEDAREADANPYDPLGVRMGSFLLFPEVTLERLFSDNALRSTTDARSDSALLATPSLTLRSDWSRHALEGFAGGIFSSYEEFSALDDRQLDLAARGRLDVSRRTFVEAGVAFRHGEEDIDSDDAPTGAADRTEIRTSEATLEVSHRINRLTASLRGGVVEEDFDDVALLNGTIANNDDRDETERDVTARLAYEFRPGVAGFVEGAVNEREFDQPIDDSGIRRGSDGYQAMAGLALDFGGKWNGEIAAGFARQDPDDPRFEDISGVILNAALEWRPSALTTWRFDASSEVEETTATNSPGALVQRLELSVEHAFRRHLIAGVSVGYELEEFAQSGVEDTDYEIGLSAEYLVSRSLALVAAYDFTKSTSSAPNNDYVENEVRVGVRLSR